MRFPRLVVLATAWLSAALLALGCGDSDSSKKADTSAKDGFVQQLDALCKSGNARVKSLSEKASTLQQRANSSTGPDQEKAIRDLGATIEAANVISREVLVDLHALEPPASEKKFYSELLDAVDAQQKAFDEFAPALTANDQPRIQAVSQITETGGRASG